VRKKEATRGKEEEPCSPHREMETSKRALGLGCRGRVVLGLGFFPSDVLRVRVSGGGGRRRRRKVRGMADQGVRTGGGGISGMEGRQCVAVAHQPRELVVWPAVVKRFGGRRWRGRRRYVVGRCPLWLLCGSTLCGASLRLNHSGA
jgi:hypothetical protein